MKKLILLLLFIPLISFSQEYFFMGNNSYITSNPSALETNSSSSVDSDMFFRYVKDKKNDIYIVLKSEYVLKSFITNEIFIYLKNGNIIEIPVPFESDYIDGMMISMYQLTDESISKITASEIHSIRYTNSSSTKKITVSNNNWLLGKQLKEFIDN